MLQYELNEVHLMNKRLYMLIIILFSILLSACQPSDTEKLNDLLDDVTISYQSPDSIDSITKDIELMTSLGDVQIAWVSSHPNIISTSGEVNRQTTDSVVVLTATLTLGSATQTITFNATVKALDVVVNPLDLALLNMDSLESYTMNITFETNDESYLVIVKMGNTTASVEALDETIYYEVDGDLCYVYEYIQNVWTKAEVTCSEKGTSELSFLNNFSKDYFVEQVDGTNTFYVLKTEYYQALQSFLNSSSTSSFKMSLSNDYIETIWMTMLRSNITFDVTIEMSAYNQTTVTLPEITA
jgi:hypothetical protein